MSRPIHFEILTLDPTRANEFYKQALGWEINAWEMPGSTYWLVRTGKSNRGIDGAIMQPGDLRQAVINTIEVVSLDESRSRIEAAGGRIVQGPHDIPNVGMHAYFADPDGTLFGVLQPPPGGQAMQTEETQGSAGRRRRSGPVRKRTTPRKPAARKAPVRKASAKRKAGASPKAGTSRKTTARLKAAAGKAKKMSRRSKAARTAPKRGAARGRGRN